MRTFDDHHPPDASVVADCVHCGFCLPACPTYSLWGEEMDSPRGRIALVGMALDGEVVLDETFTSHFDACLGCMACVTACPSGVRYDRLLEPTRAQLERHHARPLSEQLFRWLLFWLFPHPRRLRIAAVFAWLYQRSGLRFLVRLARLTRLLPPRLRALEALLPRVRLRRPRLPAHATPQGAAQLRVGLVTGCVQSVFFPQANAATVRVLAAEGCDVVVPRGQGCCGALMTHTGRDARDYARAMIATMEDAGIDFVVTNAAGCGSALKDYGTLLSGEASWATRAAAFAAKVKDVTELLATLEPRAVRQSLALRVAYHDACHLAHAQGIRAQPRHLLAGIPDLEVVELADEGHCCGSAGVYNLLQPDAAEELGRRKAAAVTQTGATIIATGNPGCALQLGRYLGKRLTVVHPVEILDAAIRGTGVR